MKVIGSKLVGDKGYISKKNSKKLKSNNIELITPKRKNQKGSNSQENKILLKKLSIVEHFFSWIKNFRKIRLRYDSKVVSYLGFVMLASTKLIINKCSPI